MISCWYIFNIFVDDEDGGDVAIEGLDVENFGFSDAHFQSPFQFPKWMKTWILYLLVCKNLHEYSNIEMLYFDQLFKCCGPVVDICIIYYGQCVKLTTLW